MIAAGSSRIQAEETGHGRRIRVHSVFVRATHWINAIAILIMIGSGWRIYNNVPIFSWFTFPEWATLGGDPEITYKLNKDVGFSNALLWHFAAMWVFFVNGMRGARLRHFKRPAADEVAACDDLRTYPGLSRRP